MTDTSATAFFRTASQPQEWYHGSGAAFDRFDLGKNKTVQDEDDAKHWNSHLGAHFTSDHRVAQEFAQRQGGGHVYHAQLGLKNPKHYSSEYDLDREAVLWAHHNGHDMGPSVSNPAYRAHIEPDEWQFHIKYDDHFNPRPEAREIAHAFRDHLKAQGHDGITYGNEYEGASNGFHAGERHLSAIAFHSDQIQIAQRHGGAELCQHGASLTRFFREERDGSDSARTAGRGRPRRQPGAGSGTAGEGQDAAGGAPAVGADQGGAGPVGQREVSFHPAAKKELLKLDGDSRKRVSGTISALQRGDEGLQTHALTGPLKGWNSTKVSRGHRVIHRDMDDGTLHIGYVGLHEYDKAINRLSGLTDFFRETGQERQAAAVRHDDGVMIAFIPPRDIAEQIAMEGGQPVDDLHITLAYLGNLSDYQPHQLARLPKVVEAWAANQSPMTIRIGGVGTFNNDHKNQHVLYAAVDIPGGAQAHTSLAQHLQRHGYRLPSEHGWTPHMTLRYVDRHHRFMPHLDSHTWKAPEVVTCLGEERRTACLGIRLTTML